jgi:peptidoglycan/xylan/chitin deacetylase (PgdA/CDA1 family)
MTILITLILGALIMTGCPESGNPGTKNGNGSDNSNGNGNSNGSGIDNGNANGNGNEGPPVYDLATKTGIEAYIADHWEAYGYGEKPAKYIALSFDDGPSGVTQNLLDALDAKKVKATFFLIGRNVRGNKAAVKAIYNAGHEIGNHSDGYDSLGSAAVGTITTSLNAASQAISEITGANPTLFRAPNVNYGVNLTEACTEQGLAIIGVSVWSNDWQDSVTTAQIIANVTGNPQDGGIINCHEYAKTVDALPDMIDGLRSKGFWIMTVGDLAIVKGKTLKAGVQYDSVN